MKKFSILVVSALLAISGVAFSQGTQINGSQIRDGTITDQQISGSAGILASKINFSGFSLGTIGAENPLTFSSPFIRTVNTISLGSVTPAQGGLGLTSILTGRLIFGGTSPTLQAATSANLVFDAVGSPNTFSIGGNLAVTGTVSINGKAYAFPSDYGAAGTVLTDAAGNGTLSWGASSVGVTLQSSEPGTADTGGINVTTFVDAGTHFALFVTTPPTTGALYDTSSNIADTNSDSATPNGLVWEDSAAGYVATINNIGATSDTHKNGLLIRTGSTDSSSRIFDLNSNNNDWVYTTADGATVINGSTTVNTFIINNGGTKISITQGSGAASGACSQTGSLYTNTSGGAGTTLYVCEGGTWAAK